MVRAVCFEATCTETKVGWHVRVVGNSHVLGAWDPKRGLLLSTSPAQYPAWKSGVVLLDEEPAVDYKYVICDGAGEAVEWEPTPNRGLHLSALAAARSLCQQGTCIVVVESFGVAPAPDAARFLSHGLGPPSPSARRPCDSGECPESEHPCAADKESVEPEVSNGFEKQYVILGKEPLGEGSFGRVWLCRRREGGADRAAKIVQKERLHERERNFLLGEDGEISLHSVMKHPNIVELFEHFEEKDTVTLVLEHCQGGDLFAAILRQAGINGKGLTENQAAVATKHTLLALAYLHAQCVVHRDLDCDNILLARANVPLERNVFKLCDLGFAARDRGEGLSDRLGSPETVAPEVVAGLRYSCPADMWSMGTLVYMMLSARSPFKAPTGAEVLRKVRVGSYSLQGRLWGSVSDPPKHVITALMVVEPRLRPTAEEALQKAWLTDAPCGAAAS